MDAPSRDPGWGPALRRWLPYGLVPFGTELVRMRTPRGVDGLTSIRIAYLSLVTPLLLILVLLPTLSGGWEGGSSRGGLFLLILVVYGISSLAGIVWARRRPLISSSPEPHIALSPEPLAAAYRAAFFLQIAFTESPALMGFAFTFLAQAAWPYLLGLAFTAVGLALAAPSRAALARRQAEITAAGLPLSLVEALRTTPPEGVPGR